MRTFAFWAYAVLGGVLLYSLVLVAWNYAKAWDLNFDPQKAAANNRKADIKMARCAAIILPQLAIPLGAVVIGLMIYNQIRPASQWWQIYTIISIYWFVLAPARRFWTIFTTIRVDQRLRELGLRKDSEGQPHRAYTALEATKLYYQNGIRSQRRRSSSPQSMLFVGRLQRLNKVAWLWRWTRYIRMCLPVLIEALTSLVWPFTATAMTLVHSFQATDTLSLHPWWERD